METNSYIRYGEAFKRQVVDEIGSGKFSGAAAASRAYGIRGATTVSSWMRRYGREDLIAKRVNITTVQEQDENKRLKKRVHELEKALADAYMSGQLKGSYLQLACEQMGVDVETFKKKHVTRLSSDRPGRRER